MMLPSRLFATAQKEIALLPLQILLLLLLIGAAAEVANGHTVRPRHEDTEANGDDHHHGGHGGGGHHHHDDEAASSSNSKEPALVVTGAAHTGNYTSGTAYSAPAGLEPIRVMMQNWYDSFYVSDLGLGNPPKSFRVVFDTGSADFWVNSKKCRACIDRGLRVYNSTASSTHRALGRKFVARYAYPQEAVRGQLSLDMLRLCHLKVPDQTFGEAFDIGGQSKWYMHVDGVLGLQPRRTTSSGAVTVFQNMLDQRLIPEPVFAIHLNHYFSTSFDKEPASDIIFGGIDDEHYTGEINYAPIDDSGRWQFRIDGMSLRKANSNNNRDSNAGKQAAGRVICDKGCRAYVDSSADMILGPEAEISWLAGRVGAEPLEESRPDEAGIWKLPDCNLDNLPTLVMGINGNNLTLTPKQYVLAGGFFEPEGCLFGMASNHADHHSRDWRLGQVFMRAYYTIFDYGNRRVGFAQAADYGGVGVGGTSGSPPSECKKRKK